MKRLLPFVLLLAVGCGTTEQRQDTLQRTVSVARTVCSFCNNICRVVPGAPQNAAAAPSISGGETP